MSKTGSAGLPAGSPSARIALGQLNPKVGDLAGNAALILQSAKAAHAIGADILLLPELALTGYPPEDLLLRPAFVAAQTQALDALRADLAHTCPGLHVVVGHVWPENGHLFNAASVLRDGRCLGVYRKQHLPDYGVFDETRYFSPGRDTLIFDCQGIKFGVLICEDVWIDQPKPGDYKHEDSKTGITPARACLNQGAQALLALNASPYSVGKLQERQHTVARAAQGLPVVYVNLVGAQDELVFDGASMVLDAQGQIAMHLPMFAAATDVVTLTGASGHGALTVAHEHEHEHAHTAPWPDECEHIYTALQTGLSQYVRKTGFTSVLIGLSGGLDSALVLALAVDALGADAVRTVMMPSPYTAPMSLEDARLMAQNLGVRHDEIAIAPLAQAFETALAPLFAQSNPERHPAHTPDTTAENIQARVRGLLLMAASNRFGSLLLTTGNKSELATGYCTLYGDMAGGFAPLKDIPKTLAYRLAHWRNQKDPHTPIIPERILTRAPSAELRPDQTDQDSLPPYEVLDEILARYIEHNQPVADIIATGFEPSMVRDVVGRIHTNEYKRRQSAIGPKITARAFGRDWRWPIANGFSELGSALSDDPADDPANNPADDPGKAHAS